MGMTELQQAVFEYLSRDSGSHRERMLALTDLVADGFFQEQDPEDVRPESILKDYNILKDYIRENHRNFCEEGIQRFLDGVGFPNPTPVRLATMVLTVQLDDSWEDGDEDTIAEAVETVITDYRHEHGFIDAKVSTVPVFGYSTPPVRVHVDEIDNPLKDTEYITERQSLLPALKFGPHQVGTPPSFTNKNKK